MLDDATLLVVWERAYGRPPFEQALILLELSLDSAAAEGRLIELPIGARDAALLRLRRRWFGTHLDTLTNCPQCDMTLELSVAVDDLLADENYLHTLAPAELQIIEVDDYQIQFRLPSSRDLASLVRVTPEQRADRLLSQCVTQARQSDREVEFTQLPAAVRQQLMREIGTRDPLADLRFDLTCVDCGTHWSSPFDIVGFLWSEVNAWCQRLLAEIHLLAQTYGWSEPEILALSRWRRQIYLGMIRQ